MPIVRPDFVDQTEVRFQDALAYAAGRSPSYVSLDIIQAGEDPSTTTVTSRVATVNAYEAASVFQGLDSRTVNAAFIMQGLGTPTLVSVQVTACVPGNVLVSAQICELCPPNYYCPGGSAASQSCPGGRFAAPGANSSSSCIPVVFVIISTTLPIPQNNFTADMKSRFQKAVALTAGVALNLVVVVVESAARRAAAQLLINSEIAADNAAAATSISQRIDLTSLNSNLLLQNLPSCTSASVSVTDSGAQLSSGANLLPAVLAGSVGGFVLVLVSSFAGFVISKQIRLQRIHRAFLSAMRDAKVGQVASTEYLPPDDKKGYKKGSYNPRRQYVAETVLGKGASGCVVKARKMKTITDEGNEPQAVAFKIIVPRKGVFDEEEKKRLAREGAILKLVTSRLCRAAVQQVAEPLDLEQRADVCWFIMEALDGMSMDSVLRHPGGALVKERQSQLSPSDSATQNRIGEAACIQLARDILAALKVLHSEGWVHCDVTPANIVHCARPQHSYEYKLIDFGSALHTGNNRQVVTGDPAYRAPELFQQQGRISVAADIWSLGVTMFELVTGRLPFRADGDSNSSWASAILNLEEKAPDVRCCLAGDQLFDSGVADVIAKALDKIDVKR